MSKLGAISNLVNKFQINRALAKTNFGYVEGYLYVSRDDERQFIQNVVDSIGYLPDSLIDEMSPHLMITTCDRRFVIYCCGCCYGA